MVVVSDGNVDALTVGCGAPFDPAQRAARADRRGPDDPAVVGIERPVDAALLADADDVPHQIRS